MNINSIVVIIAIIVIAIPIVYGIWSVFSVEQLQMGTVNDEFRYFELSNFGEIQICNPMPFFVSFNGLKISAYYANDLKGEFILESNTLEPKKSKVVKGNFYSESFAESQYFFLHMDWEFYDEGAVRIDPSQMEVLTNVDTTIIGIIPYQATTSQSGFDFIRMMNENLDCENTD